MGREEAKALKQSNKEWEKLSNDIWQAKRDLQLLLKEMQSTAGIAVKELEEKITAADRLAQLLAETMKKLESQVAQPETVWEDKNFPDRYGKVLALAGKGRTVHEIAQELSMGSGEVALVLQLKNLGQKKAR